MLHYFHLLQIMCIFIFLQWSEILNLFIKSLEVKHSTYSSSIDRVINSDGIETRIAMMIFAGGMTI